MTKRSKKSVAEKLGLGATGEFPNGKVDQTDEGALRIHVSSDVDKQIVRIEFGKQIAWIGMPRDMALQFANLIGGHAMKLKVKGE